MVEDKKGVPVQPVETLAGEDLNRAFSESIRWLRQVAYDPCASGHIYRLWNGHISSKEIVNGFVFKIERTYGDVLESYNIRSDEGLVSFKRESNASKTQSSILGDLPFDKEYRYFVCNIRQEETVQFGTQWLERESERNPHAKWAMEEMKRAAIKVVRVCQG